MQECLVEKTGNGMVTQSEESMILITSYRLPHYGNRSFTFASDDVLWSSSSQQQVFDIASGWRLSSVVILNGGKNAVQEKRETGQWHRVKNLWFWWHLTAFLTTGTEPSHSLRMTSDCQLILTHTKIRYPSHLTSTIFLFLKLFPYPCFPVYASGEIWEPYTSR